MYHDSSLFTASLRRERLKAKLKRLKEKERRVIDDRKQRQLKQRILQELRSVERGTKMVDLQKVSTMSICELLRKKH